MSSLLIITSLMISYKVILDKRDVVTTANLKDSLREAIQAANTAASTGQQASQEEFPTISTEIDDDPIMGDTSKAKVAIVEFSDYECPFCKRHFTQTDKQIRDEYISTGKAYLVFRDFPLEFHDPMATTEAIAAECVHELGGNTKYFEYHDLLFTNTTSNGNGLEKAKLYDYAAQIGIDRGKFTECLDSQKYKDEVTKDIQAGTKSGITGTPGFIIGKVENGKVTGKFINGAYPYDTFKKILDEQLSK